MVATPFPQRRHGRRLTRLLIAPVLAGALLVTAACSGDSGGAGVAEDTPLYIGTVNPVATFDPMTGTDIAGQWALRFAMDTLMDQPEPLKFIPKLAKSIETEDNQNFTIKLQEGAKWSDGEPITADDVVFTLNLTANPESLSARGGNISSLEGLDVTGKLPKGETEIPGLEATDETTVVFSTQTPVDPNYIKELIGTKIVIVPEHVLGDIPADEVDDSEYVQLPDVTSGPYKFTKYTQNASIEYEANPDYYLGKPKINKIIIKIMPASNLAGELQSQSIQMNSGGGIGNIPFNDLKTVEGFPDVTTKVNPTIGFQTLQFNVEKFPDPKVRQAFAHAINRQQIVDELLRGNGEVIDGPYTSQSPYLDKDIETLAYDPDLAKQMLTDAGWDFDTLIDFVVPTGNEVRERSADIMLENFKAIGLNVEQTNYDFPTTLGKARKQDYDFVLMGLNYNIDPDVSSMYASTGGFNLTGYNSEKSDELLLAGKSEPDIEARHEIYNELQQLWQDDLPVLTLYSDKAVAAVSNVIAVGGPAAFWNGSTANFEQWAFEGAS